MAISHSTQNQYTENEPMITLLLPKCGISDLIFKLRITIFLLDDREFNVAFKNYPSKRNLISETFFTHGLGFNALGLHHIDIQAIDENAIVTPYDVFADASILDQHHYLYIDLDYPFWKHSDMMTYADQMSQNHPVLEAAFMSGDIYRDGLSNIDSNTVFVQYRLGDVALVPGTVVNKALSVNKFVNHVFIGPYLIKKKKLRSFLSENPPIRDRIIIPEVYEDLIGKLINEGLHPTICSDGYTLTAKTISKALKNKMNPSVIEQKLTSYMLEKHYKIVRSGVSSIIGENEKNIEEVFKACLSNEHWVLGTSKFPFSFFINSGMKRHFKHELTNSSPDEIVASLTSHQKPKKFLNRMLSL